MDRGSRRYVAVVVAVVLTCDAGLLLGGHHPWSGPEILGLSHSHGLHATDPLLLAIWALAMASCWWWACRPSLVE